MKIFYIIPFCIFFYLSGYGQSCSWTVIELDEVAAVNQTYALNIGNYHSIGALYEIYINDDFYDSFYDDDGARIIYSSKNIPGEYEYTIHIYMDGVGYCGYETRWISILETITDSYTVRSNSPLRTSNGSFFFVNSLNELCMAAQSGGSWYDLPLNYNAPDVHSGTRFTNETELGIFYVGTDHKIYQMVYNGGWTYSAPISNMYARGNTDLEYNYGKVFYFDNNRKMCAIAGLEGANYYNFMLNANAPAAKDGTGFTKERTFDGATHIYYVSSADQLIEMYYTSGTGWDYSTCIGQVGIRSDSDIKYLNSNTSLVWIGTNNRIMGSFKNINGWYNFVLNNTAPTVKSGTEFFINDDKIYYIGSDNRIYKLYYSGSWQYIEAADRQMEAKGSLTMSSGDLFFTRNDDNRIYYYPSDNLKSAKINSSVAKSLDIEVYPNPTNGRTYIKLPYSKKTRTADIYIYDIFGKLVLQKDNFERGYIDISDCSNGTYFMKIQFNDCIETHKILLQN